MMDDEPERMDPRCDAGGRGYMLWMEYCNDGEYIRATDYDALAAKLNTANPLDDPRVKALVKKARAVVDRWDSPLWKDLPHTGESIADLRAALSALEGRT